jgi:uncharacterized protein (TIGR02001 family)
MKKIFKNTLASVLLVTMSISTVQASEALSSDEGSSSISYNMGYMSEYWFRGAYQAESSVSFGADYEAGNFYLGTWWADVDQGMEGDLYFGYNFGVLGIPSYIGMTGYYYTDNFDRDYEEVNIGMDFGVFAIDAAINGNYESGGSTWTASSDYGHIALTVPLSENLTFSYQTFTGGTLHTMTHEISYAKNISGVDVGLTIGANNDSGRGTTAANSNQETTYANFTLGYAF